MRIKQTTKMLSVGIAGSSYIKFVIEPFHQFKSNHSPIILSEIEMA